MLSAPVGARQALPFPRTGKPQHTIITHVFVTAADTDVPTSYSTLGPFPWAEYAPYTQREYSWNTAAGSNRLSLALTGFPAPVFLLTPEMAADARQRATYNSKGVSLLGIILAAVAACHGVVCVQGPQLSLSAQSVD